jgi:outer membrane protein OmpA-like peptidoglycan-associated protein
MRRVRLTLLGKAVILIFIIVIISGFTYVGKNIPIKTGISAYDNKLLQYDKNTDLINIDNLIVPYKLHTDMKDSLEKITLVIYFPPNLSVLGKEYFQALNIFTEISKNLNDMKIQIEGNTAVIDKNSRTINDKELSMQRAETVAAYLMSKGITSDNLIITGNGCDKPIGDNNTRDGRKLNRRVDISFVEVI